MLGRIDEHHAVLVVEALVAFDEDREIAAVLEREPRAAVGEHVRVHRRRRVERRPHALAGVAIPRALRLLDVDAGHLPQVELGHVRAALVAARDERRLRRLDLLQRFDDVLAAGDLRGIALRPDQHEVVVHHGEPLDAFALGQEFLLGRLRVDEDDIGVAAPREVERLPGAERDDAHLDAGLLLEDRQQVAEQSRLLGRRRRGDGDEALLRLRRRQRRAPAAEPRKMRRATTMAVLLPGNGRPRREAGCLKN